MHFHNVQTQKVTQNLTFEMTIKYKTFNLQKYIKSITILRFQKIQFKHFNVCP